MLRFLPAFARVLGPVALVAGLLATSCGSSSDTGQNPIESIGKPIGPEGGNIDVGGAVVTFPKGAVTAKTQVTISVVEGGVPEGFIALSKVFRCEPSGTSFAQPVEMKMPFKDDGKGGTLFWSSGADPAFKDLGGRVEGATMVATVMHFSSGFVGRRR